MVRILQPLLRDTEENALSRVLEYLADEAKEYKALSPEERKNHIYRDVLTLRAASLLTPPLFELGNTVSTPGAVDAIRQGRRERRGLFTPA